MTTKQTPTGQHTLAMNLWRSVRKGVILVSCAALALCAAGTLCAAVPEKKDSPVPEKKDSPVPEKKDSPVPEKKDSPVPEKKDSPVPEKKDSPVPEKKDGPASGEKAAPAMDNRVPAAKDKKPAPAKEAWISLFNGKDLTGWKVKIAGRDLGDNYKNTFRVENGILKVCYDQYDKFNGEFGHIFYKDKFSHYRMRVEYRFVGEQTPGGPEWAYRNNGIMFHCQSPESMGKDQAFPVSIEAQMLGGNGKDKRSTGNVCTPGTNIVVNGKLVTQHVTESRAKTYHGDQWVTMEIEVHGNGKIKHIINGEAVLEYEKPQLDPSDADAKKLIKDGNLMLSEGYVALQAESHPAEFRKVEILLLKE
jgi:hypothetical protein